MVDHVARKPRKVCRRNHEIPSAIIVVFEAIEKFGMEFTVEFKGRETEVSFNLHVFITERRALATRYRERHAATELRVEVTGIISIQGV